MSSPEDFDTAPDEFVEARDDLPISKNKNTATTTPPSDKDLALFTGMKFFLNNGADALDSNTDLQQLIQLIVSQNGTILNEKPSLQDIVDNNGKVFIISPYNDTKLPTLSPTYIKACCSNKILLKWENYLVPYDEFKPKNTDSAQVVVATTTTTTSTTNGTSATDANVIASNPARTIPTHNKTSFTEEEDEFILDVVRKNPTRRTTHTLFDEISHYVPNHTGNSIRHRYRVYLSKRLEYVYQVDEYGKLVRDENGNLTVTKILPPSIKKKFTADDDYNLAIGVKTQFYRDLYQVDPKTGRSLINEDDSPTAVAKRNMTMDPNHVPGTEPAFKDYKVGDRRGPLAREFFKSFAESNSNHTENAWRDRFRKFLLSYGIDAYIEYYETCKSQGIEAEPMKNFTNRPKRNGLPTPGNYNNNKKPKVYDAQDDRLNTASKNPIPENELLDEDTMNFISSLKNDLSKLESTGRTSKNADNHKKQTNNVPFEYPQEIAEAIRNDFSNEEAEFDNIDPDTIPFPPEIASIDLFLPQFFRMANTREFLNKVNEVISRDYEPSQAEKLVQDLCDEVGVRKTFSTSILTALSGDLMVFPRYFLNMFKHNVNPPLNVPGVWTREDDAILRENREEDIKRLIKKHGSGRIEMRRRFIEKDLI